MDVPHICIWQKINLSFVRKTISSGLKIKNMSDTLFVPILRNQLFQKSQAMVTMFFLQKKMLLWLTTGWFANDRRKTERFIFYQRKDSQLKIVPQKIWTFEWARLVKFLEQEWNSWSEKSKIRFLYAFKEKWLKIAFPNFLREIHLC